MSHDVSDIYNPCKFLYLKYGDISFSGNAGVFPTCYLKQPFEMAPSYMAIQKNPIYHFSDLPSFRHICAGYMHSSNAIVSFKVPCKSSLNFVNVAAVDFRCDRAAGCCETTLTLLLRNMMLLLTFSIFWTRRTPLFGLPRLSPDMISRRRISVLPSARSVNRSLICMWAYNRVERAYKIT